MGVSKKMIKMKAMQSQCFSTIQTETIYISIRYIFIYEYSDFKGGLGDAKGHSQHAFAGLQAFQSDMIAALADSLSISSIHITLTVSACQ